MVCAASARCRSPLPWRPFPTPPAPPPATPRAPCPPPPRTLSTQRPTRCRRDRAPALPIRPHGGGELIGRLEFRVVADPGKAFGHLRRPDGVADRRVQRPYRLGRRLGGRKGAEPSFEDDVITDLAHGRNIRQKF